MGAFNPIAVIKKFWYADSVRTGKERIPGACQSLINTSPNINAGERVRSGYTAYNWTAPTGLDILKVVPIQNPTKEDVHISFANGKINMYPYWSGTTKINSNVELSEHIFWNTDMVITSNTITILNAIAKGFKTNVNYYKNFVIKQGTKYAIINGSIYQTVAGENDISNPSFENYDGTQDDGITDSFEDWIIYTDRVVDATASTIFGGNALKFYSPTSSGYADVMQYQGGKPVISFWYRAPGTAPGALKLTIRETQSGHSYNWTTRTWGSGTYKVYSGTNNVWTNIIEIVDWKDMQPSWELHFRVDFSEGGNNTILDEVFCGNKDGSIILTTHESLSALGFSSLSAITAYRYFHDNLGFSPSYNNDKYNPPTINAENNVIRLSGGCSGNLSNRGLRIDPLINKKFFPNSNKDYTFTGTYVSERECKAVDIKKSLTFSSEINNESLPKECTYWLALAPIYDGYQIGKLQKYETYTDYTGGTGTNNYISEENYQLVSQYAISLAIINKRIIGFAEYIAKDIGDTRLKGRQTPYYYNKYISLIDSNITNWTFNTPTQKYELLSYIDGIDVVRALGSTTYQTDSGLIENASDIMYSYSTEEIIGGRRYITNNYINSESKTNRTELITNPVGGNPNINAGIVANDIFSNEESVYRHSVQPTTGNKIQALIGTGIDEILCIKDLGIALGRIYSIGQQVEISWKSLSTDVGLTTINEWCKDDEEYIYFPSYQDIFRYKQGNLERLIERPDFNDWLDTYKNISDADKESVSVWYLPRQKVINFNFGNRSGNTTFNGLQYSYYIGYGWRQVRYNENISTLLAQTSFKWITKLQNGIVLGIDNSGMIYQFSDTVFNDGATRIIPYLDSGDFLLNQDESKEFVFNKMIFNRTIDSATQGVLSISIYLDNILLKQTTFSGNENKRCAIQPYSDDKRVCMAMRFVYNTNTNRERLLNGVRLQLDNIEIYGYLRPK